MRNVQSRINSDLEKKKENNKKKKKKKRIMKHETTSPIKLYSNHSSGIGISVSFCAAHIAG